MAKTEADKKRDAEAAHEEEIARINATAPLQGVVDSRDTTIADLEERLKDLKATRDQYAGLLADHDGETDSTDKK